MLCNSESRNYFLINDLISYHVINTILARVFSLDVFMSKAITLPVLTDRAAIFSAAPHKQALTQRCFLERSGLVIRIKIHITGSS